jgi:hypothetical protein
VKDGTTRATVTPRHRERMMLSQDHPHHSNRTVPHTTSTPQQLTHVCPWQRPFESATGERVVSSTQSRLTGSGGAQHVNLNDPMFAKLREKVVS